MKQINKYLRNIWIYLLQVYIHHLSKEQVFIFTHIHYFQKAIYSQRYYLLPIYGSFRWYFKNKLPIIFTIIIFSKFKIQNYSLQKYYHCRSGSWFKPCGWRLAVAGSSWALCSDLQLRISCSDLAWSWLGWLGSWILGICSSKGIT